MSDKETVTQEDVAERAGVSRAVVSYVINNGPRKVSEATRQRVLTAISELGYRPNKHAQFLKQGSDIAQNSIGIVTGGRGYDILERPYYNMVLSGLYDTAYQYNQQISFMVYWDALKDPVFFNKHIHEQEISSLIFVLPSHILRSKQDEELLKEAIARVPHIVCLEEHLFDLPAVIFDRADAARSGVNHLIDLGHRDIAFVAIHDERLAGYKQALMENNISYNEAIVDFLEPSEPVESSYNATSRFLDSGESFSAVFTATDEAAIGAMASIIDHGLRIPDDIAIVSIDNIEIASMIRPSLTTVDVPKRTLARLAIQSLITQKDFPDQSQVSMLVPIKLVIRESCGSNLNHMTLTSTGT